MDAPFEHNDDTTMMTVTKNILLAHGRTVQVLRKNCPDAKVGIAPTGDCCLPKDGSPEEVEKAQAKSLSHYPATSCPILGGLTLYFGAATPNGPGRSLGILSHLAAHCQGFRLVV